MKLNRLFAHTTRSLALLTASVCAQADDAVIEAHKKQLLEKFPNAQFTEVEVDWHRGQEIFEYEFQFKGKAYEAFMTREGKILRLGLD